MAEKQAAYLYEQKIRKSLGLLAKKKKKGQVSKKAQVSKSKKKK